VIKVSEAMKYEYPSIKSYYEQLGSPLCPRSIWQQAFDYDQEPLENMKFFKMGMERSDILISSLSEYNLDLMFVRPLQENLMLYWLPLCMDYWQRSLFEKYNYYFVWSFYDALSNNPNIIAQTVGTEIQSLTYRFMRDSIIARISEEKYLIFLNPNNSSQAWIDTFFSFGCFADDIAGILNIWSKMDCFGFAISYFQYVIGLIYEYDFIPIYKSITPYLGCNCKWKKNNVESLEKWLEVKNIELLISKAKAQIKNEEQIEIVSKIENAFLEDQDAVEYKVLELLEYL